MSGGGAVAPAAVSERSCRFDMVAVLLLMMREAAGFVCWCNPHLANEAVKYAQAACKDVAVRK